jgi:hypothetical protein
VPRQPTSNLDRIAKWLSACRSKHDTCNNWCSKLGTKHRRPTRILELRECGVQLRCNLHANDKYDYVALSHMWGENPSHQLQLTTSNLLAFQSAIPLQKLSNIYAEAIRITRYLGFNYIWIDSLCIIQDSLPDWTAEASTMSMVYNNAICTVAFLFPREVGFIQSRGDPRALTPCTICEPSNATKGSQVMLFDEYRAPDSDAKPRLLNRAWAFQEHILSPRTILYGDHTIK